MHKILSFTLLLLISSGILGQEVGRVDKRTKAFTIAEDQKAYYLVFGYQFPNETTRKMICFSSKADNLRANYECPLGAFFDTGQMNPGDRIVYLGMAGKFGKMNFIAGSGKSTVFYLPRSSYVIK